MYKLIALLKRKPGMTPEAFKDYYENRHSRFSDVLKGGKVVRYFRRYFTHLPHPASGLSGEPEFDAMFEMWFEDEDQFKAAMALFTDTPLGNALIEDEENLFDRSKIRHFIVEEHESDMS